MRRRARRSRRASRIYRTLGDEKGIARSLSGLATVATYQCDYPAARGYGEEVLAGYEAAGDKRGAAVTLHNLGFLSLCEGDAASAAEFYRRSLGLLKDVGDLKHTALTLADLAVASARLGDLDACGGESDRKPEPSCGRSERSGKGPTPWKAWPSWRFVLMIRISAIRFLGAARALREEIGSPLSPAEQQERASFLDRVRAKVGEHRFPARI